MKTKHVKSIRKVGWLYECEIGNALSFDRGYDEVMILGTSGGHCAPLKTKKCLVEEDECLCMKGCKAVKVEVVVKVL